MYMYAGSCLRAIHALNSIYWHGEGGRLCESACMGATNSNAFNGMLVYGEEKEKQGKCLENLPANPKTAHSSVLEETLKRAHTTTGHLPLVLRPGGKRKHNCQCSLSSSHTSYHHAHDQLTQDHMQTPHVTLITRVWLLSNSKIWHWSHTCTLSYLHCKEMSVCVCTCVHACVFYSYLSGEGSRLSVS